MENERWERDFEITLRFLLNTQKDGVWMMVNYQTGEFERAEEWLAKNGKTSMNIDLPSMFSGAVGERGFSLSDDQKQEYRNKYHDVRLCEVMEFDGLKILAPRNEHKFITLFLKKWSGEEWLYKDDFIQEVQKWPHIFVPVRIDLVPNTGMPVMDAMKKLFFATIMEE